MQANVVIVIFASKHYANMAMYANICCTKNHFTVGLQLFFVKSIDFTVTQEIFMHKVSM